MNNLLAKPEINLYFIKSQFNFLVSKLCSDLLKKKKKILINLKSEDEMNDLDRFLWTTPKDCFLPHRTLDEKIDNLDNILLFNGDYLNYSYPKFFKILLVSPSVTIKKFKFFEKFLVFSYQSDSDSILKKKKLENIGYNVKSFQEYDQMKWKTL
tara:strand:- start:319 stop:780 length:462 start_codon:yes stop_codon:yes gene_type:complete